MNRRRSEPVDSMSYPKPRLPRLSFPWNTPRIYGTRTFETSLGSRPCSRSQFMTFVMAIRSTSLLDRTRPHSLQAAMQVAIGWWRKGVWAREGLASPPEDYAVQGPHREKLRDCGLPRFLAV